jgi:hypothetical protein
MLSREEYERVIESFLMELQATYADLGDQDVHQRPTFVQELHEAKVLLCNPESSDSDIVGYAFGVVDEFVHAAWTEVMHEAYALYVDLSGNQSHRHPQHESKG